MVEPVDRKDYEVTTQDGVTTIHHCEGEFCGVVIPSRMPEEGNRLPPGNSPGDIIAWHPIVPNTTGKGDGHLGFPGAFKKDDHDNAVDAVIRTHQNKNTVSEMSDTSGPLLPSGRRTYRTKPAGTDQFESRSDSRKIIRRKETNTMYRESKNPKSMKSTKNSGVQRRGQTKNKVKEARLREYGLDFDPNKTDFSTREQLGNFIKEKVTPVLGAVAASAIIALSQEDNFIKVLSFIKNAFLTAMNLKEEYSISRSSMKQYVIEAAVESKNPNVMKFIQTVFASKVPLKEVVGVIDEILKYANSLKTKKVAENMNYKPSRISTKGSYNSSMSRTNRGVMREMPDTSGPVGTQPGGWRDRRTFEDTAYAGGMGQGHGGQSYRKFKPKMAGTFNESELDEAAPLNDWLPPDLLGAIDVIRTYANGVGLGVIITGALSTLVNALHGKYKKK